MVPTNGALAAAAAAELAADALAADAEYAIVSFAADVVLTHLTMRLRNFLQVLWSPHRRAMMYLR